jgi:hypothetical protein
MRTLTYRDLINQSVSELVTGCHHHWLLRPDNGHDSPARR